MDFQIMLLPRKDYWEWVRACREYVMRYSANLTSDPETAARYMAPLQVVSFPNFSGAFEETGDLLGWFSDHHEGIWLDPINASSPTELEGALSVRLGANDRFGQRQKPFFLLWPTVYPVVTQPFGANPHIYTRFGMPGHEGLDIRALPGSDVYCCADGWVYRVHKVGNTHAYGVHIRVQHEHGFKTVYGHLQESLVEVGQQVKAGELIARADSTGASTAAHLHLTLKKDGATIRKETKYPKDVIDPTPYMVLPDRSQRRPGKGMVGWPEGRCLLGAQLRIGGEARQPDIEAALRAKLDAVRLDAGTSSATVRKLRSSLPEALFLMKVGIPEPQDPVDASQLVRQIQQDIARHYQEGIRQFELAGPANLQSEGWNRAWHDGAEFAEFLTEVIGLLRRRWPDIQLGFPGLSPGSDLSGWREDSERFLDEAASAVLAADWLGVHCHWRSQDELRSPRGGRRFTLIRDLFPEKDLVVTEFSNPDPNVKTGEKARQYLEFHRMAGSEPAVRAVFCSAISAEAGYQSVVWGADLEATMQFAQLLSDRSSGDHTI